MNAAEEAELVRQLLNRKCYCEYCYQHRERARGFIDAGTGAVLRALASPAGMICGGVESMMERAHEALQPTTEPQQPTHRASF